MKKVLKWIFLSLGLLIVIAIGVVMSIDPNQFKPDIEHYVKAQTGRELKINGPIEWTFYPSLGLTLRQVQLLNPKDYPSGDTASLAKLDVSAQLLPLITGNFVVGKVQMDQLKLHIIQRANGQSNLQGLIHRSDKSVSQQAPNTHSKSVSEPVKETESSLPKFSINGINIHQLQVTIDKPNPSESLSFHLDQFSLGAFAPGQNTALNFSGTIDNGPQHIKFKANGQLYTNTQLTKIQLKPLKASVNAALANVRKEPIKLRLNTSVDVALNPLSIQLSPLKMQVDNSKMQGKLVVNLAHKPMVDLALSIDQFDMNQWMSKSDAQGSSAHSAPEKTSKAASKRVTTYSNQEPNLSFLQSFNGHVSLEIGKVMFRQGSIQQLKADADLKQGVLRIQPIKMQLYQGKAQLTAQLDSSNAHKATYQGRIDINDVAAKPLLQDFADTKAISGTVSLNGTFKGDGLSELRLMRDSRFKGKAQFKDGAIHGQNIELLVRNTINKFKGKPQKKATPNTEFSSLLMQISKNGWQIDNPLLVLKSSIMTIKGQGKYQLNTQQLDYGLGIKVTDKYLSEHHRVKVLKDMTVPLNISGKVPNQLNYHVDIKSLLDKVAKQEIKKQRHKLEDKLKDKLKEKLKDKIKLPW